MFTAREFCLLLEHIKIWFYKTVNHQEHSINKMLWKNGSRNGDL